MKFESPMLVVPILTNQYSFIKSFLYLMLFWILEQIKH